MKTLSFSVPKLAEQSRTWFEAFEFFNLLKKNFGGIYYYLGFRDFKFYTLKENVKVVKFRVTGEKHRGWVYLNVAGDDTFTVRLVSTHNNLKKVVKGVYLDQLVDTLYRECTTLKD